MAVGDVVSAVGTTNSNLFFQPAAGVEIMITWFGADARPAYLYNGTNDSLIGNGVTGTNPPYAAIKVFITNSNWLWINATVAGKTPAYCGIQIK